uniref:Addiction module component n=1 Tax=Candidatus Kentrum sp. UNK TaxID=2126344 RepID=A0A451ABY8_9GAMM|nr:MAG: Putative addiction module component [Candidatus Kentron sp. UNK]VFK70849.1 MAG: Putative addiction module component [Candidatus Kentron sp. UNK]
MINAKINEASACFDDEEREIIEEFEKAPDKGTLVSPLTPVRCAELQASARLTLESIWRREIDKRIREIDTGTVACIPWEEVREKLYRNTNGKNRAK